MRCMQATADERIRWQCSRAGRLKVGEGRKEDLHRVPSPKAKLKSLNFKKGDLTVKQGGGYKP